MKKLMIAAAVLATMSGCASVHSEEILVAEKPFLLQESMIKGKTFAVTHMNGEYLKEDLSATMVFGEDNRLSGRGFCNMYMSSYEVTYEDVLEVSGMINTRKMCSEDKMKLEGEFNKLLRHKMTFEESELGYKVKTDVGSFRIMEIDAVTK